MNKLFISHSSPDDADDSLLFNSTLAMAKLEDFKAAVAARLRELPPMPNNGFIARSRELLPPAARSSSSLGVHLTGRQFALHQIDNGEEDV